VLIDFAIAVNPSIKFAFCHSQPGDEALQGYLTFLTPKSDKINDGITDIMGNPAAG
jgi:hypothetical protein